MQHIHLSTPRPTDHVALMSSPPHWVLKLRINVSLEVLVLVPRVVVQDLVGERLASERLHRNADLQLLKIIWEMAMVVATVMAC